MLDLTAIATRLAYICSGGGRNECSRRTAALCAALVAIAILIAATWHPPLAHADGGAAARSQAAAPAPNDSGATIRAHTLRILRALTDHDSNNWVRYWRARAACDAAPAQNAPATPVDRALLALTAALCAHLDARLGVNPAVRLPPDEDRSVGLLINEPGAALGYTLFTGYWNHDVFLLDPLGRVAHAWHMDTRLEDIKLLDNGNLLVIEWDYGVLEYDPDGNTLWQYKVSRAHHDSLKMPNGNVLLLTRKIKTREQAIAAGANPEFISADRFSHDYLLEVRPASPDGGEIVWEWSPWDHLIQDFDPTKPNYGIVADHPELIDINFLLNPTIKRTPITLDWLHTNTIAYNPELDQIMLSPRHFSELWIIDHSAATEEARGHSGGNSGMGGDLLYRWGNPRAYGRGTTADQRLFWQHQPHWIPPGLPGAGNILLFNNGNEFPGYERFYSSIDEIVLPADGYSYRRAPDGTYSPDELAWTYVAEPPADFYAQILSGAQRLPNGNTLVVDGTGGTIFQITPDGRTVWKYVLPLNVHFHLRQGERPKTVQTPYAYPARRLANSLHRAYWYPPDHPALQALDLTPGAFLEDIPDLYDIARDAARDGAFGEPLARSDFDIYLDEDADNRRFIYIKQPCAADDAQPKFFLHIFPVRASDIPADRREHGFDNHDFNFDGDEVKASTGRCVAMRDLPEYPIQRIRTGQHADAGALWQADIDLGE